MFDRSFDPSPEQDHVPSPGEAGATDSRQGHRGWVSLDWQSCQMLVMLPEFQDDIYIYIWSLFVTSILEDQLPQIWSFPIKTEVSQALGIILSI